MSFKSVSPLKRQHPCFFAEARGRYGRIHLPVAPACNIQCAYCRRDHDCVHENRPGVTAGVLSPEAALDRLERALFKMPELAVAGIAGPGDAFCDPELTLETFERIRQKNLDIALCVSSNGLNVKDHIPRLVELGVQFVTITVNAGDAHIGALLVETVRKGTLNIGGRAAAQLLIDRQMEAIAALKAVHITVKVNSVVVPGINEAHLPHLAKKMRHLGVDLMNLLPLIPVQGTALAGLAPPPAARMRKLRQKAGAFVPQMYHCARCRSDALGLLHKSGPMNTQAFPAVRRIE